MIEKRIPENASKNIHNVAAAMLFEEENISKVLDVPCGAGAFTKRLKQNNYTVYAGDIENLLVFDHKDFVNCDLNLPLPFEENSFDAIACIDGIEHLENPFLFIRECNKALRKGGVLLVSTPNISAMRSRWRHFLTGHHNKNKAPLNEKAPNPLHHINMFSYQRLRYVLHTNGFKISQVKTNRVKFPSWFHIIFYPFALIKTYLVFRKEEKDPEQRKTNIEILKALYSKSLYFGEAMIIKAKKV